MHQVKVREYTPPKYTHTYIPPVKEVHVEDSISTYIPKAYEASTVHVPSYQVKETHINDSISKYLTYKATNLPSTTEIQVKDAHHEVEKTGFSNSYVTQTHDYLSQNVGH